MLNLKTTLLAALLVAGTGLAQGQYNNSHYYQGMRDGGRGGSYNQGQYNNYNNRGDYNNNYHQGGVGPGKGAAIGAGGGALLGGLLGGGLKGALIGGAAGAGIGAIAGKEHQNNVRRNDYYGR